jgi:ABC-type antimicrobial peptide transport system permease subunit
MTRVVDDNAAGDNLMSWMLGTFAALALVLAAVGIFGVVAYSVAQRTREVGIRMALGAEKSDVLRLVVGQSALLTATGVTLGLLAAWPIPNLLGSAFSGMPVGGAFEIAAGVAVMVASVALLASYIPARRATRVEPVVALRYE